MKIFFVKDGVYEHHPLRWTSAKAALKVCDYSRKAESIRGIDLPSGMKVLVSDGDWGSVHERWSNPAWRGVFVYAERLAGGWMGRMRRAAKIVQAQLDSMPEPQRGDGADAWWKGAMIHIGMIREEGDQNKNPLANLAKGFLFSNSGLRYKLVGDFS